MIRALRLRYELLDNGSIARVVMRMAQCLEYSPRRLSFAIVHCEFLYTLCDKVHRNPSALLPVVISDGVNTGALGREFLLLNWSVQHLQVSDMGCGRGMILVIDVQLCSRVSICNADRTTSFQDAAGGEYAQRGVLALLQIPDSRVTHAVVNHSALIERTVRMVENGFQSAINVMQCGAGGMDEVGAKRQQPDPAAFYAAMRFCDHIVRVADLRVAHQLLHLLDNVFLRKTLQERLLKGSEAEQIGIMEMVRGLFEPEVVWPQHGRNFRRLQQPQLISMLARMLVGLPSLHEHTYWEHADTPLRGDHGSEIVLDTLVSRVDSVSDAEACEALQLLLVLVDLYDTAVMEQLVFLHLRREPYASAIGLELDGDRGEEGNEGGEGAAEGGGLPASEGGAEQGGRVCEASSRQMLEQLDGLLLGVVRGVKARTHASRDLGSHRHSCASATHVLCASSASGCSIVVVRAPAGGESLRELAALA